MDGPEGINEAINLHEGDAGEPLFTQQENDKWLCQHGEPRHHRDNQEGTRDDGPPHEFFHHGAVVLVCRKGRKHYRLDGIVDVVHDQVREMVAAVVVGEVRRREYLAYDEPAQVGIERVQERRTKEFPAETEQRLEPLERKFQTGAPRNKEPHDEDVQDADGKLLDDDCPHARSVHCRYNACNARRYHCPEAPVEQASEHHVLDYVGVLDGVRNPDGEGKREHADYRRKRFLPVKVGDERSCRVEHGVGNK